MPSPLEVAIVAGTASFLGSLVVPTINAGNIRKAFHTEAKVFSYRDGKLNQMTSAEFAARFTDKPAPDEAQRKRWIENVKITGNAGFGVIVLDYPTTKFTDYMSLLKVDGKWKIINKTFHADPKAKP